VVPSPLPTRKIALPQVRGNRVAYSFEAPYSSCESFVIGAGSNKKASIIQYDI